MTGTRKLAMAAILFAVAIAIVALAAVTKVAAPLFAAWVPLVGLAWILGQPPPGESRSRPPEGGSPEGAAGAPAEHAPAPEDTPVPQDGGPEA